MQSLNILVEKGDLRQSINRLQSLSKLSTISSYILPAHDIECKEILENISKCSTLTQAAKYGCEIQAEGFAIDELLSGFYKQIKNMENEKIQALLLEALSSC